MFPEKTLRPAAAMKTTAQSARGRREAGKWGEIKGIGRNNGNGKSEVRSPKSERNPKPEIRTRGSGRDARLGLRLSEFFRPSTFGLRASDFGPYCATA